MLPASVPLFLWLAMMQTAMVYSLALLVGWLAARLSEAESLTIVLDGFLAVATF